MRSQKIKKQKKNIIVQHPLATTILLFLLFLALPISIITTQSRQSLRQLAAPAENITVDFAAPIRTLDPKAIGMDISGYGTPNVFANDTAEQQKLRTLGIKYMRMHLIYTVSGDPTSKIICGGAGCDTRWTGDQWITAIKNIGAEPVILVYTKSSIDAANMVKHFNKDTNNPVKYWIIGNEPSSNGYTVQSYSDYFNQDYDAMKAIDPTIKIGGGTTAWFDPTWLRQFLQLTANKVDFVDFHGYPQKGDIPGDYTKLFQNATGYGNDINQLRGIIQSVIPNRANQIGIQVGEWELNWGGSAQNHLNFHSVWAATTLGNILKAGGLSLFYADKGNALYMSSHTYTDSLGRTFSVQPDDTNPAYHGIGMFTGEGLFPQFGTTIVSTTTTLPNIEVFASDNPKNIVIINKDPTTTQLGTFGLNGVTTATIDIWRKDETTNPINPPAKIETISLQNGNFNYNLPPFSITTFVIKPTNTTTPPQPTFVCAGSPNGICPTTSPSPTPITISPTTTVLPTAIPQGKILASDNFQRPDQQFWGTASDGKLWKGDANTKKNFSIKNNAGQIGNGYANFNATVGENAANVQILFSGKVSIFDDTNLGGVLRWQDTNNWYKAYIDGANLWLEKKVNGTNKKLRLYPFKAAANISYTIRFQVVGDTLSAKVWTTGTPEPANWQITAKDTSLTQGYCGLRALIQTGKSVTYTSFTAIGI
jgi:hypothetical protein